MASGWNLWVWLEYIGVVSQCGSGVPRVGQLPGHLAQ